MKFANFLVNLFVSIPQDQMKIWRDHCVVRFPCLHEEMPQFAFCQFVWFVHEEMPQFAFAMTL